MSFSIIIPSRNATNLTACVKAVRAAGETSRIIVVDDGVDWQLLHEDFAYMLDVVRGVKPFVFARNCNIGIRAAGEDSVCILNDDALLKTTMGFTALHRMAEDHPEYGIIASSCNNVGNINQWRHRGDGLRDEPRTLCFIAVMIPRRTINAVGLLDERFVNYGMEDDDYCLRVRRAGLKLGIFDGCFVDHHTLQSSFRSPSPTNSSPGNYLPNMKLFIEKWGVDNWNCGRDTSKFKDLFPPEVS